jgi:hypothetical protein
LAVPFPSVSTTIRIPPLQAALAPLAAESGQTTAALGVEPLGVAAVVGGHATGDAHLTGRVEDAHAGHAVVIARDDHALVALRIHNVDLPRGQDVRLTLRAADHQGGQPQQQGQIRAAAAAKARLDGGDAGFEVRGAAWGHG